MCFHFNALDRFVPRGRSPLVFALAMACYGWAAEGLTREIIYFFRIRPSIQDVWILRGQPLLGVISALSVSPLLESMLLVGAIELLRWIRFPQWLQVVVAAAILAGPHSVGFAPRGFIVLPAFIIQAASYLYWRRISRKKGFLVVAGIHALLNLIPTMLLIRALIPAT
jgi:hypothetical protein